MKIGILTSEFASRGALPAEGLFAKIKDFGFAVTQLSFSSVLEMEFAGSGQFELPEKIDGGAIGLIGEASKKHGVAITVCGGTFNMAHPDAAVREEGVRRFEALAGYVKQLGCNMISLCSGTRCESHMWAWHKDNDTQEAWDDMIGTAKKVAAIAEKHDIVAAVETEMANIINSPEKARKMMDEVGSPNLKMVMDCANLFPAGEAKKENARKIIGHAFEVFGGDVVIAHGKDIAQSDGISFCPTGEGIVDFGQFVELLGKYGYGGDMILHGIYDEEKIRRGREMIKDIIVRKQR